MPESKNHESEKYHLTMDTPKRYVCSKSAGTIYAMAG
jgi:hypothetical protein